MFNIAQVRSDTRYRHCHLFYELPFVVTGFSLALLVFSGGRVFLSIRFLFFPVFVYLALVCWLVHVIVDLHSLLYDAWTCVYYQPLIAILLL